jgi:hypothetical protein
MKQFKVQSSRFKVGSRFLSPFEGGQGDVKKFQVSGFRFRREGTQLCHCGRHCEEERRSNLLITLKNRLLLLLKKQDRNDDYLYFYPSSNFKFLFSNIFSQSNYSVLTTPY